MADTVELEVTLDEVVDLDRIDVIAVLEHTVDLADLSDWEHEWHALVAAGANEERSSTASHPVTAAIHGLVRLARLPGRAALATQHIIEAFAKITPRLVDSLV